MTTFNVWILYVRAKPSEWLRHYRWRIRSLVHISSGLYDCVMRADQAPGKSKESSSLYLMYDNNEQSFKEPDYLCRTSRAKLQRRGETSYP